MRYQIKVKPFHSKRKHRKMKNVHAKPMSTKRPTFVLTLPTLDRKRHSLFTAHHPYSLTAILVRVAGNKCIFPCVAQSSATDFMEIHGKLQKGHGI